MTMLIVLCCFSRPAVAQVDFGIKGGIDLVELKHDSKILDDNNRAGYFIGPTLFIATPILGLGVDVSVLYHEQRLHLDETASPDTHFTQRSIVVPGNVRLGVNIADILGVFLAAGLQLSVNVGDDIRTWRDDLGYDREYLLQQTTLSSNLGIGAHIGRHLEAAVFYDIPFGKTADFSWNSYVSSLGHGALSHATSRTNAWRLALTYYF